LSPLPLLVIVTGLNLSLGLLVYSRNPRRWVNRSFAFFALAVAAWSTGLATKVAGSEPAILWARWSFLAAALSTYTLVLFFHTFPSRNELPRSLPPRILTAFTFFILILSTFTPWVVAAAETTPRGRVLTYGPLYPLYAVYIISCVGYSLALMSTRIRAARKAERHQLIYLCIALLVPGSLAVVTNLLVPLVTKASQLTHYGPLFSVLMIAMVAHAIIRHRLMNIRLVVRRGVVYLIAATVAGAVFASVIALIHRLTPEQSPGDAPFALQVSVALVIALAFEPLKRRIQGALDKYLYRESYDYQRIVRDASKHISAILDLKSLLDYVCEITSRTMRPDLVAVFTREADGVFSLTAMKGFSEEYLPSSSARMPMASPLPAFLAISGQPLLRDEVNSTSRSQEAKGAAHHLSQFGGELALPMLSEHQLIGFLVVGPKLSGDPYFTEDIELLLTLSHQVAISVQNAQLYRQVLLVNEYVENILRTMDSGVITVDADGRVALCNATAEDLTGISRRVLTSLAIDELPDSLSSQLRATLKDGHPILQIETVLPGGSDRLIPIVCSTSALRDRSGAILGALIVFTDLSRLKALESERRRAQRLASFGALASGIAHEIKNPLVAIRTFAELLPERFNEVDFREDFSKVVIGEIDRIDGLVARLGGIATPAPQVVGPVDIRESIIDTLALLRAQLEQTQTVVHRKFEESAPYVAVDDGQLKQLFLNLFINAIEAMGPGGELTVRLSRKEQHGTSWLVAEVSDTGPGIPESIRSDVFDPFFTTKTRGSGLGLAICRGISDAHRGTIRAENRASGSGTTIIVEFPAAALGSQVVEQHQAAIR
jgi:signal transduction histidine kinase